MVIFEATYFMARNLNKRTEKFEVKHAAMYGHDDTWECALSLAIAHKLEGEELVMLERIAW